MTARPLKALVIGAGIGGLAAAIALRRANVDVEVFERAERIQEVGAGLAVWANGVRALDRLGVGEAVRAASVQYPMGALRTWNGDVLTAMSAAELRRLFDIPIVIMHRADLLSALAAAFGAGRVRLGHRCAAIRQEGGGVTAEFENRERARGDLLVGADGLHSVVRSALHGPERPVYAGCSAWRAAIAFDTSRVSPGESWGGGSVFGMVPIQGRRAYWYATMRTAEGGRNPDEKGALLRAFRGWHAPIAELIEATEPSSILRNDIYDRPVLKSWTVGRATLLGDAAHPMLPYLGQGACQALEDAVALGEACAEYAEAVPALRAYQARRLARANMFVTRSRYAGRVAQLRNPIAVAIRNAVLKRAGTRLQLRQLARLIDTRS